MAFDILGQPLDWGRVQQILDLFPDFEGDVPQESLYWSQGDLELFFGSYGQLWPKSIAADSTAANYGNATCTLLSHLRQVLAEWSIEKAASEYRSFCRHLKERITTQKLPNVAQCVPVQRVKHAHKKLKAPMIIEDLGQWKGRQWDMQFWLREYGSQEWVCRARSPPFEHDIEDGAESINHGVSVAEYVDYVDVVQKMDPECKEDNGLAFPRVILENWTPFAACARDLFARCYKDLVLPGVKENTRHWLKICGDDLRVDWSDLYARLFKVTLSAPGAISRLHVENNVAHTWFYQVEGKRLFFLFPPQEAKSLYAESGKPLFGVGGYTAAASPVDIYFPSTRRHPQFGAARAQFTVLSPGEALVLPGGWWRYAVALEPSVTLHHCFWNFENRQHLTGEVSDGFDWDAMSPQEADGYKMELKRLQEEIMEDSDSDAES